MTTQPPSRDEAIRGSVSLSPSVVATAASKAALDIYGVVGLADRNPIDGIARLLNISAVQRGIDIRFVDGAIEMDIRLIVEYGTRISEVARNVQQAVKFAVERTMGMPVQSVSVSVQDLHLPSGGS